MASRFGVIACCFVAAACSGDDATDGQDAATGAARDGSADTSRPDSSPPDVSAPDVSSPDASNPDASAPDASDPDALTLDASAPDTSLPDASDAALEPDVADATITDAADAPDTSAGDAASPDASVPSAWSLPTQGVCSVSGWCWKNPLPVGIGLYAVWGLSATDFWAMGRAGSVVHYDGSEWRGLTNILPTTAGVGGIQGTAANDVWFWDHAKTFLHWDGAHLQVLPIESSYDVYSFYAAGPSDVWIAGQSGMVRRWNGSTWSDVPSGTVADLKAIAGYSSSDLYAAGASGTFLHWDGVAWTPAALAPPAGNVIKLRVIPGISGLWSLQSNGLYYGDGATWTKKGATGIDFWALDDSNGVVLGTTFNTYFAPGTTAGFGFATTCNVEGVWGITGFDYVVVTDLYVTPNYAGCPIFRTNGADATSMVVDAIGNKPTDLAVTGPNDVWLLKSGTQTIHGDGTSFTPSTTLSVASVLTTSGPSDVWALGQSGGIVRHFSGAWEAATSVGQNVGFTAVSTTASNDVWAIAGGHAWHWDGTAWSDVGGAAPGTPIWGDGASLVYVGGQSIQAWNGTTWSIAYQDTSVPKTAVTLWGSGANDVWAMSGAGNVYHFGGTSWSKVATGTFNITTSFAWSSGSDAWAISGTSAVAHWDGTAWTTSGVGDANIFLTKVSAKGGEVWLMEDHGGVLRRTP